MKVSIDEVKYISKLSKLSFSEEDASKMAEELESVLECFKTIDNIDLSDIDLNTFNDKITTLRKDELVETTDKKKLFQNTKSMRDGSILVPKIIE